VRVLHLTKVQGIGGAEQHLLALLPALRARGIDARFLSLDAGGDAARFHDGLDKRGIPWERVACGLDVSPRLAAEVTQHIRSARPDLVHTHMVHADAYGSLAAHVLRIPFVSTRHNDDRYLLGPFRYVDRGLMHGVRRIVAISDAVRTFHIAAGLPPVKLETIHYGLDETPAVPSEVTPEQLGVPAGAPLVLTIGRLIASFSIAQLLAAPIWGRVSDRYGRRPALLIGLSASAIASCRCGMVGRINSNATPSLCNRPSASPKTAMWWRISLRRLPGSTKSTGGDTPRRLRSSSSGRSEEICSIRGWPT